MPAGDYEVLDPRFKRLFNGNAHVNRLYTGCLWAEGPAWFAAGRYLVWSDIPNNRILRYDETSGNVSVFRQPCGNTNGHTVDRQGRLVSTSKLGFEPLGERPHRNSVDPAERVEPREARLRLTVFDAGEVRLRDALGVAGGHFLDGVQREPAPLPDVAQVVPESLVAW